MSGDAHAPGWGRSLAASLIAPLVAGPAFFPPFLILPPFALMAIAFGYVVAIAPTLLAGAMQDRLVRSCTEWRRAGRWYLVGAASGVTLFAAYAITPIADLGSMSPDERPKALTLMGLGCGSAGGAVAIVRYWIAYCSRPGRRR